MDHEPKGNDALTRKQLEEARAREEANKRVTQYLGENDVYFVTKDNKYWKFVSDTKAWVPNVADALKTSDARLRGHFQWEAFLNLLKAIKGVKDTRTYSFLPQDESVLNMMRTEHWLQPKAGTVDPFFDHMMYAISGGKEENALHIKQLLGWKYLHPETWQLPALTWYGAGGVGKNLFAEKVLQVIFGQGERAGGALKCKFNQVERFNDLIAGKAVVYFDERPSRDDESMLKFLVGSPTLSIEGKHLPLFTCENTAWYILATNGEGGAVRIEKNGTERRWSIIKVTETLEAVVMRRENVDQTTARSMIKAADAEVFGNPDKVAVFLQACIDEAQKLDTFPHALHGEDFEELLSTQQTADEDILTDIFSDSNFTEISVATLHEVYRTQIENNNPGQRPLSIQNLNARAMEYITNNKLSEQIKRTHIRINVKRSDGSSGKSQVYYNATKMREPTQHTDRLHYYLSGAHVSAKPKLTAVTNKILEM